MICRLFSIVDVIALVLLSVETYIYFDAVSVFFLQMIMLGSATVSTPLVAAAPNVLTCVTACD